MKWKIRQDARLLWRNWDCDEILVFDAASGDTHLVNEMTAEVLQILERLPQDSAELCRKIGGMLNDSDQQADFEAIIAKLLDHLDRLGLVEPES